MYFLIHKIMIKNGWATNVAMTKNILEYRLLTRIKLKVYHDHLLIFFLISVLLLNVLTFCKSTLAPLSIRCLIISVFLTRAATCNAKSPSSCKKYKNKNYQWNLKLNARRLYCILYRHCLNWATKENALF